VVGRGRRGGPGTIFAGPISGASTNPARSLGPAQVSGRLDDLAIYLIAPPVGGLIGIALLAAMKATSTDRQAGGP
jgi:aquaporin Z